MEPKLRTQTAKLTLCVCCCRQHLRSSLLQVSHRHNTVEMQLNSGLMTCKQESLRQCMSAADLLDEANVPLMQLDASWVDVT